MKDDVPDNLVECYDLVHIRNFLFVLLDADIPRVITNLVKLLSKFCGSTMEILMMQDADQNFLVTEPGGYLQWGE